MTWPSDVAPDYVEPLQAWRLWRVVERDGRLFLGSVVKPTEWPVGQTLVGECLQAMRWPWRKRHVAPEETCNGGIYGSTLEHAAAYAREVPTRRTVGWAIGTVSLGGTVVECERGFRASHAYPAELWVPRPEPGASVDCPEVAARLTEYGVPVQVLDGRAHEAAALLAYETSAQTRW